MSEDVFETNFYNLLEAILPEGTSIIYGNSPESVQPPTEDETYVSFEPEEWMEFGTSTAGPIQLDESIPERIFRELSYTYEVPMNLEAHGPLAGRYLGMVQRAMGKHSIQQVMRRSNMGFLRDTGVSRRPILIATQTETIYGYTMFMNTTFTEEEDIGYIQNACIEGTIMPSGRKIITEIETPPLTTTIIHDYGFVREEIGGITDLGRVSDEAVRFFDAGGLPPTT